MATIKLRGGATPDEGHEESGVRRGGCSSVLVWSLDWRAAEKNLYVLFCENDVIWCIFISTLSA